MGNRSFWPLSSAVLAAAILAPLTASCLEPTEIDLQITTDVPSANIAAPKQARIQIGTPDTVLTNPSTSVPTNPVDATGSFGDLFVVPNGDQGASVAVRVSLGVTVPTSECDQTPSGCVVASRTIRYVPHRKLVLPINLESSCLGVSCDPTQTCVAGTCVDNAIDTNTCDGGTCGPGSLIDATAVDATGLDVVNIIDALPETATGCLPPSKVCNSTCVNVTTNLANCGDCGIDCTGGVCANGTCMLNPSVPGKCLAVYQGNVYVLTATGAMFMVPTHGGAASAYIIQGTGLDVTSIGTDWAYSSNVTAAYVVFDQSQNKSYPLNSTQASRIALDDTGFAWFSEASGALGFTLFSSGTQTPYTTFPSPTTAYLASAHGTIYASVKTTQLCRSTVSKTTCVDANTPPYLQGPTGVAVSDTTTNVPAVFVVESGSTIVRFVPDLSSRTNWAVGGNGLGAVAYDAPTTNVYSISPQNVVRGANGNSVTSLAATTNAVTRCLASDATSVYWLETAGGLFKHSK